MRALSGGERVGRGEGGRERESRNVFVKEMFDDKENSVIFFAGLGVWEGKW